GTAFHDQACRRGLEGIISKRASSAYSGGRNRHWCKIKCSRDDDFVVVGFTDPRGARIGFGSLLLGTYDNNAKLVYSGRVGTGFKQQKLRDLRARLRRLERVTAPSCGSGPAVHSTHWVKPQLVVEGRFSEYTQDGRLRHPAFRGLREDKNGQICAHPATHDAEDTTEVTACNIVARGRAGLKITQLLPGPLGVDGRSGFATLSTLAVDQA